MLGCGGWGLTSNPTSMQAAADPKFAHTLRRLRLGHHSVAGVGRTGGGGADSGASTPAHDPASAREALQRAAAAARLSPEQTHTITGVQPATARYPPA